MGMRSAIVLIIIKKILNIIKWASRKLLIKLVKYLEIRIQSYIWYHTYIGSALVAGA